MKGLEKGEMCDFSSENMQARREGSDKVSKGKKTTEFYVQQISPSKVEKYSLRLKS